MWSQRWLCWFAWILFITFHRHKNQSMSQLIKFSRLNYFILLLFFFLHIFSYRLWSSRSMSIPVARIGFVNFFKHKNLQYIKCTPKQNKTYLFIFFANTWILNTGTQKVRGSFQASFLINDQTNFLRSE